MQTQTRKRDKAEIQSIALGVVIAWLRQESHGDEELGAREIQWCQEAQDRIACFVELEELKLRLKGKTASPRRSNAQDHPHQTESENE